MTQPGFGAEQVLSRGGRRTNVRTREKRDSYRERLPFKSGGGKKRVTSGAKLGIFSQPLGGRKGILRKGKAAIDSRSTDLGKRTKGQTSSTGGAKVQYPRWGKLWRQGGKKGLGPRRSPSQGESTEVGRKSEDGKAWFQSLCLKEDHSKRFNGD